jgi:hypothetical protein
VEEDIFPSFQNFFEVIKVQTATCGNAVVVTVLINRKAGDLQELA